MTPAADKPLPSLLRPAFFLSSCLALFVLFTGATETSATIWARANPIHLPLSRSTPLLLGHQHGGSMLLVLLVGCAWLSWKSGDRLIRWLALIALSAGACEVLTVLIGPLQFASLRAVSHAICGHTIFACLAAASVIATSTSRAQEPVITVSRGFPLLALAAWIPPLVLTQVVMGALYRHDLWSVLPHMVGAMTVGLVLISEGVVLRQNAPGHRLLSRAAVWAIALVLTQISIGIADFLVRLLDFEDSLVWLLLSIAHVTVAALTLTVSICLAVAVRAYVGQKAG